MRRHLYEDDDLLRIVLVWVLIYERVTCSPETPPNGNGFPPSTPPSKTPFFPEKSGCLRGVCSPFGLRADIPAATSPGPGGSVENRISTTRQPDPYHDFLSTRIHFL